MKHREVFNCRMNVQSTKKKMALEMKALWSLMRQILETHSQPESHFKAFRVIVVALEDPMDPHLCPHCTPARRCETHVSVPKDTL